jgi:S1-C subfamily serine protease
MRLTLRQFALYFALLLVGGATGLLVNRYFVRSALLNGGYLPASVSLADGNRQNQILGSELAQPNSPNFIAEAVEAVGPAVVRIDKVVRRIEVLQNPILKQFFGDRIPEREERGTGSGFILTADGRILTNAHVIDGTDTVKVTLKDGRTFQGRVIGTDPITDVAVVKIDATALPIVRLGKSEDLLPGQWAIAIGNPLGLDNTVTAGIISATNRSGYEVGDPNFQDKRVNFIQTDAAINPGNSGGPLLNDRGEVIGINTVIRADAQGLGFAIPIQTAERVAKQLFVKGKVEHPYLGIQMVDLTAALRKELNAEKSVNPKITQDTGILIVRILANSPAAKAGLREGDIIQKMNGQPVKTAAEIQARVEASEVGSMVKLEVNRNGQSRTFQVKLAEFPGDRRN